MTDHEHNSTSADNTGKTPEKAKAPKDPGTALITTNKSPEAAKAPKNSGNASAGSGKAPEKANAPKNSGNAPKASGNAPKNTGKAPEKASGNAPKGTDKAPVKTDAPKAAGNAPVNSGKSPVKAKSPKAPAPAPRRKVKAPEPVTASKVSPSVVDSDDKTPVETKTANVSGTAPASSGKTPVETKTTKVSGTAPASSGKAPVETKATKVSDAASVSSGKAPEPAKTSKDSSAGFTPTKNAAPTKPPKSGKTGLLIGILIAAVVVIILGVVLYNRFFVPKEIHVSENALLLEVGDGAKLTYVVLPESADNLEVAWASSDPAVATVDEFGVVTAVSGGQCIIAVATGNNKTDTCVVTVNDHKQVQKESLATIVKYVDSQETAVESQKPAADSQGTPADSEGTPADSQGTAAAEGEYKLLGVKDIDDAHSFLIGAEGEDLVLVYRTVEELEDLGVDALYTTYVRMKPEDTETADIVQENNLVLYGFPISTTASGVINLSTYQYGDKVALSDINSTVNEIDATNALQEQADKGTAVCIHEFASFLDDLAFEFGVAEFGLEKYQEPTGAATVEETKKEDVAEAKSVPAEAESGEAAVSEEAAASEKAAATEDAAVSKETAATEDAAASKEAAVPEDTESMASVAESTEAAAESAPAETSSAFSEFPKAGPTSSAVSFATDSLAKAG